MTLLLPGGPHRDKPGELGFYFQDRLAQSGTEPRLFESLPNRLSPFWTNRRLHSTSPKRLMYLVQAAAVRKSPATRIGTVETA